MRVSSLFEDWHHVLEAVRFFVPCSTIHAIPDIPPTLFA